MIGAGASAAAPKADILAMNAPTLDRPRSATDIGRELDHARSHGPLRQILIPPCPELLARLRQALACAEPDLNEVARIAGADVAMSATLIRAASGAAFSGFAAAQTVGQAMTRLGLEQTAAVMTGFLTRRAIPANNRHLQRFWERSTQRAMAMEHLAHRLPGLSPDLAYTFGLFAHVGQPVMLQSLRGYGSTMVEGLARRDQSFVQTENANHRTDHAVVGALVARVWALAPAVMAAIRLHHDLNLLGAADVEAEVQTLVAAGLVAEHLMRRAECLDADPDWIAHGQAALHWLQWQHDDIDHWGEELAARFDELRA